MKLNSIVEGGVVLACVLVAAEAGAAPLVLASRSVSVEEGGSVFGDVGVRGDVAGPMLVPGQRLAVAKSGKVGPQGFSCAETILLSKGALAGALDVTTLTDLGGQHGAVSPVVPLPLLPAHAPFEIVVGAADVTVPPHGIVDLHPSGIALGDVVVGANGTLRIFGGAYDARRLRLGPSARVEIQSDVVFHLAEDLRTDVHATVVGAASATVDTDAAFIVEGIDADGDPSVRIGPFNAISASVRVVAGTLRVEHDTVVVGEFVGRDVSIGRNVTMRRATYGVITCPAVCFQLNCPAVCFSHDVVPSCDVAACPSNGPCGTFPECRAAKGPNLGVCTLTSEGTDGDACPSATDECNQGRCASGECRPNPITTGTPCLAADACNTGQCTGGTCSASSPLPNGTPCSLATDTCHTGQCTDGGCSAAPVADGTKCGAGDACNAQQCEQGTCTKSPANEGSTCGAGDSCNSQKCALGTCGKLPVANGTACAPPPNLCTPTGQCTTGQCIGIGLANGTPCSNGNPCDGIERCHTFNVENNVLHVCQPGVPLPLGTPCPNGNPCNGVEVCLNDAVTGKPACEVPPGTPHLAPGTSCSDGDPCNGLEICDQNGSCLLADVTPPSGTSCGGGCTCLAEGCTQQVGNAVTACVSSATGSLLYSDVSRTIGQPYATPNQQLFQIESSSAIVPASLNNGCPSGRFFVSYGDGVFVAPPPPPPVLLPDLSPALTMRDLGCDPATCPPTSAPIGVPCPTTTATCITGETVAIPTTAGLAAGQCSAVTGLQDASPVVEDIGSTDNQVVVMKHAGGQRVLHAFIDVVRGTPKYQFPQLGFPNASGAATCAKPALRAGLYLRWSDTCGQDLFPGTRALDPATFGYDAFLRRDLDGDGVEDWRGPGPYTPGLLFGGFDRVEIIADSFVPERLYMSADLLLPAVPTTPFCTGAAKCGNCGDGVCTAPGENPNTCPRDCGWFGNGISNIYTSGNAGEDWKVIAELPQWAPTVMTTTANGRLFAFQCVGATIPTLYWLDAAGATTTDTDGQPDAVPSAVVSFVPPGASAVPCNTFGVGPGSLAGNASRALDGSSIARKGRPDPGATSDTLRIAYPSVEPFGGGVRQIVNVVEVTVRFAPECNVAPPSPLPATCVTVKSVQQIRAIQPTWSVIMPHFVESNRLAYPGDDAFADAAMLEFIEASQPAPSQMAARYRLAIGDAWSTTRSFPSSTSANGVWNYSAPVFGVPVTGIGDYAYGAFSAQQLGSGRWSPSFASVWPETDQLPTGKYSMDTHTNSVAIAP